MSALSESWSLRCFSERALTISVIWLASNTEQRHESCTNSFSIQNNQMAMIAEREEKKKSSFEQYGPK